MKLILDVCTLGYTHTYNSAIKGAHILIILETTDLDGDSVRSDVNLSKYSLKKKKQLLN